MAPETTIVMSERKHTRKARASSGKKKSSKKAKHASSSGRPSAFSGKKIFKVSKENPRREGSIGYKSWRLIKNGMSYEKYLAAGGRRQDLAFDLAAKNVRLSK